MVLTQQTIGRLYLLDFALYDRTAHLYDRTAQGICRGRLGPQSDSVKLPFYRQLCMVLRNAMEVA